MSGSEHFSMKNGAGTHAAVSVVHRIENSMMGMWHMMTEQLLSSKSSRWIGLCLMLFDTLTMLSLAVSDKSILHVFLRVSIQDWLPAGDLDAFATVYGIVQIVIWFAILDGAFVAWSFAIGRFRALWPALVLRAILGIVGTALYNPFLEVLVIPLRCDALHFYWRGSDESSHARRLVQTAIDTASTYIPAAVSAVGGLVINAASNATAVGSSAPATAALTKSIYYAGQQAMATFSLAHSVPYVPSYHNISTVYGPSMAGFDGFGAGAGSAPSAAGGHAASHHARMLSSEGFGTNGSGLFACPSTDTPLATAQIALIVLSLIALMLFIPFALSTQLVYIESDPASAAWDAMSSGRDNVLDSAVRTILVLVTFFVKDKSPIVHAAIFLFLMIALTGKLVTGLPFYLPWYNMLRSGLYGLNIWIALESLVLAIMTSLGFDEGAIHTAATIFIATLFPFGLIVAAAPLWQYKRMRASLAEVLLAVEESETKSAHDAERAAAEEAAADASRTGNAVKVMTKALSFISHGSAGVPPPATDPRVRNTRQGSQKFSTAAAVVPSEGASPMVTKIRRPSLMDTTGSGAAISTAPTARTRRPSLPGQQQLLGNMDASTPSTLQGAAGTNGAAAAAAVPAGASNSSAGVRRLSTTAVQMQSAIEVLTGKPPFALAAGVHAIERGENNGDPEQVYDRDNELVCVTGHKSLDTAHASRRFQGRPDLVEHMAILTLKTNWNPKGVSHRQHAINIHSGLYSRKAISIAERVFEHGLLAFPQEPAVRIAYARFLATFAMDSARAIGMLQSVVKCQPRLEDRFALFSFGRSLDQKRQSSDLGEGELDAVGIIAFRQTQSQALRHHSLAVSQILTLWKLIDARAASSGGKGGLEQMSPTASPAEGSAGVAGPVAGTVSAATVTEQIAKIVESRRRAQNDYDKLLARYPNAVLLLRSYMSFLQDVLNEPQWAASVNSRIESLLSTEKGDADMNADGGDKKSAYMSVAGGALSPVAKSVRGDGAASQAASSTGSLNRKGLMSQRNMENGGTRSVASMRWKMHAGLVALAVLASIIFAVSKTTLGDFSHLIDIIYHAGRRRYNVVSVGFHSRTVVLSSGLIVRHGADSMCNSSHTCGAIFQDAREKLMAAAQELQSINADLYDPTDPVKMFDRVRDIYDYPFGYTTNQVDLGPPPVNISVSYGLQALLVKYAGNGYACSQMPVTTLAKCAQLYCDDPVIWRFIQDSWYVALVGADTAVAAYVDQAFEMENQFKAVALGLLAVVIFLVFVLWTCVFWPAALSVQASNAGVLSISDSLPREAVRALIKRYTRLVQQLDALSQEVAGEGADDDAESDRGMDSDEEGGENGGEGGDSGGNDGSRADSRRQRRGDSSAHREEGSSSVGSDDSAERVDDQDLGGGSGVYRHKAGTAARDGKGTLSLAPSQHQQHGGGRAGTSARGAGSPVRHSAADYRDGKPASLGRIGAASRQHAPRPSCSGASRRQQQQQAEPTRVKERQLQG